MLIILLFLSEFLIGSIAFVFRGGLKRTLANELRFGIEEHYNATDRGSIIAPSVAAIWDNVQMSVSLSFYTLEDSLRGIRLKYFINLIKQNSKFSCIAIEFSENEVFIILNFLI